MKAASGARDCENQIPIAMMILIRTLYMENLNVHSASAPVHMQAVANKIECSSGPWALTRPSRTYAEEEGSKALQ